MNLRVLSPLSPLPPTAAIAAEAPHLPDMPLHDPYILAHEASLTYYLHTSNRPLMTGVAGVGTMVYKSKDLLDREPPKTVFTVPSTAFARQQGGWAPEVHEYKGRFHLFTTLHNEAKTLAEPPEVPRRTYVQGTIVAVSVSPDGPFTMLDGMADRGDHLEVLRERTDLDSRPTRENDP